MIYENCLFCFGFRIWCENTNLFHGAFLFTTYNICPESLKDVWISLFWFSAWKLRSWRDSNCFPWNQNYPCSRIQGILKAVEPVVETRLPLSNQLDCQPRNHWPEADLQWLQIIQRAHLDPDCFCRSTSAGSDGPAALAIPTAAITACWWADPGYSFEEIFIGSSNLQNHIDATMAVYLCTETMEHLCGKVQLIHAKFSKQICCKHNEKHTLNIQACYMLFNPVTIDLHHIGCRRHGFLYTALR